MYTVAEATEQLVNKINARLDATTNVEMAKVMPRYSYVYTQDGQQYIRLLQSNGGSNSVIGFIIKYDGNKFGSAGDILMSASVRAPAKGVRGSVYSDQGGMEAINDQGRVRYAR